MENYPRGPYKPRLRVPYSLTRNALTDTIVTVETMKQLSDLHAMRHSTEHVLTMAMLRLYGKDKVIMAMGPSTEDGYYFDFDTSADFKISEEQFSAIEMEMHKIVKENLPFIQEEITPKEARKIFNDNTYKLEWIEEIEKRKEKVSIYRTGDFVDLCSGPHVATSGQIGAFKLLSVAGAYWHGSEKNKMLTRIYGTCFQSQKELDTYLLMIEEAKKRDHRVLGKTLGLFAFSDLVGKGLPMLTAKGATIRRILERFIVDEELKRGYSHVVTPPLAKVDLYKTSGHYPYYKETMYPPMKIDDEELILRPMHVRIISCCINPSRIVTVIYPSDLPNSHHNSVMKKAVN
jgi:threonyl-tRNA synthetase